MEYKMISEVGNREINEDYVGAVTEPGLSCFVLADGLGGHGKGEVASEMATESILAHFKNCGEMSEEQMAQAFEDAQQKLLHTQAELHAKADLKTTAVVLLVNENSAMWGHVGDSRLYLFYKNKVVLRTLDHSVPQMLVLAGDIKEKQIRLHPDRNRLLRVMGNEWGAQKYDISEPRDLSKCQAFLMCTDGFWEYITEKMMCKYLKKSKSAEEWMQLMLDEVKANGANADMDNHSAIAVWI